MTVNCIRVLNNTDYFISSGKNSVKLWNINQNEYSKEFKGEIYGINKFKLLDDFNIVSANVDATLKKWDFNK